MAKTFEENFIDWESSAFGFGYGSGERHIMTALKTLFASIGNDVSARSYDYEKLEAALTPTVAWLLINLMCSHRINVFEYGTSPRFGWLTQEGEALKAFVDGKTVDELVDLICNERIDHNICYPDSCNCGPNGYLEGAVCRNPFWKDHH